MCVVSMVGDYYKDKWIPIPLPQVPFDPNSPWPAPERPRGPAPRQDIVTILTGGEITREEFNALKKEVEEMKELLTRALEYDKRTRQEHCEIEEKMELLRRVAAAVGIDLDDILKG